MNQAEQGNLLFEIRTLVKDTREDVKMLRKIVIGNGDSDKSLVVRVAKNTSFRYSVRKFGWLIVTVLVGLVGEVSVGWGKVLKMLFGGN